MIHAKNYETASIFVKVIRRKLLASFSGHGVESCLSWVEWSRDRWRQAYVWRHAEDIM